MNDQQLIINLESALRDYLGDVPFCGGLGFDRQFRLAENSARVADLVVRLTLRGKDRLIIITASAYGQPQQARLAADQLVRWKTSFPTAILLFAAPYVSPDSAAILRPDGIGFVDLSGNCLLFSDGLYIKREGWPNKFAKRRDLRSLYSPKAERVLHTLLKTPAFTWKVKELVKEANVSLGLVASVKKLLEGREWVRREADGLLLTEPIKLLVEWGQNYRFERNTVKAYLFEGTVSEIETKLTEICREMGCVCALAGFSAAAHMRLTHQPKEVSAYVTGDLDAVAQRMGLNPLSGGTEVRLIQAYDERVLTGCQHGASGEIQITSAVQTYLDLMQAREHGPAIAKAVLDQVSKGFEKPGSGPPQGAKAGV